MLPSPIPEVQATQALSSWQVAPGIDLEVRMEGYVDDDVVRTRVDSTRRK
jgi:hypothetical protein